MPDMRDVGPRLALISLTVCEHDGNQFFLFLRYGLKMILMTGCTFISTKSRGALAYSSTPIQKVGGAVAPPVPACLHDLTYYYRAGNVNLKLSMCVLL